MKKYIPITVVLGFFGILLLARQFLKGDEAGKPSPSTSSSQETTNPQSMPMHKGKYKDGIYTGPVKDAFYGNVQVQVSISGGKITDVQFLQAPNDNPTTRQINAEAMPLLRQEAIQAQSAKVDIVSSASQTSNAFIQSLSSVLQQAS